MSRLQYDVAVRRWVRGLVKACARAWEAQKAQVNGGYDLDFRWRARRDSNP